MTYDTTVNNISTTYNVSVSSLLDTVYAANYIHKNSQTQLKLLSSLINLCKRNVLLATHIIELLKGLVTVVDMAEPLI